MKLKTLALALLAGATLPPSALAQTAPPDAAAQPGAQPRARDSRAMGGLTAAPTDFGTVHAGGGEGTPGDGAPNPFGVTRTDLGGGYMIEEDATKTRSTVTRDAIDKLQPTASPYQMIQLLPGVNAVSTDNIGLSGGNVRVRGFNSDHLGFTIEGAPINDSGNFALYPQEYVDSENISSISIAQGSADLDSPHIGAVGGVINMYMIDPSKTAGGVLSFSAGSNATFREYMRVDTGQIGDYRGYVSFSHLGDNHWNHLGRDDRYNIEMKSVYDIDAGDTIRLSVIYNDMINNQWPFPTLAQYSAGNYTTGWPAHLPGNFKTLSNQSAYANYAGYKINPFKNVIASAPSNFTIAPNLTFDTIPYFWYGFGNGGGVTAMNEATGIGWGGLKVTNVNYGGGSTLTDNVLYYNPSITETVRPGVINKLTWTMDTHKLVLGYWLEDALHHQWGPFEPLASDGSVADPFAVSNSFALPAGAVCKSGSTPVACPSGPMQKRAAWTHTLTNVIFVGDTWTYNDKLTFELGAKQAFIDRHVVNQLPYAASPVVDLHNTAFLPTAGVRYRWDDKNQFIASVSTTIRTVPNYNLYTAYANGAMTAPINSIPPERGVSYEIGHRYQGELFATSVTGFLSRFDHFQQSTNEIDPAGTGATYTGVTLDVGRLMVYGVDAEIGFRRWNNFRPYVSGELVHSEMLDNWRTTTTAKSLDYLPTKGKQLPGTPNSSVAVGVDYDDGHILGNLIFKAIAGQYSTYVNDERIPGYGRLDAMIGYRFDDYGWAKKPTLQLNLFNLTDRVVLTGVNSLANNAKATTGTLGGAIAASGTPNYYLGQGFSALLTMKTAF